MKSDRKLKASTLAPHPCCKGLVRSIFVSYEGSSCSGPTKYHRIHVNILPERENTANGRYIPQADARDLAGVLPSTTVAVSSLSMPYEWKGRVIMEAHKWTERLRKARSRRPRCGPLIGIAGPGCECDATLVATDTISKKSICFIGKLIVAVPTFMSLILITFSIHSWLACLIFESLYTARRTP